MSAPLPAPYPVPAPIAAPDPAPTAAPVAVPHAVSARAKSGAPIGGAANRLVNVPSIGHSPIRKRSALLLKEDTAMRMPGRPECAGNRNVKFVAWFATDRGVTRRQRAGSQGLARDDFTGTRNG